MRNPFKEAWGKAGEAVETRQRVWNAEYGEVLRKVAEAHSHTPEASQQYTIGLFGVRVLPEGYIAHSGIFGPESIYTANPHIPKQLIDQQISLEASQPDLLTNGFLFGSVFLTHLLGDMTKRRKRI